MVFIDVPVGEVADRERELCGNGFPSGHMNSRECTELFLRHCHSNAGRSGIKLYHLVAVHYSDVFYVQGHFYSVAELVGNLVRFCRAVSESGVA